MFAIRTLEVVYVTLCYNTMALGEWRSLVARMFWVHQVVSSNLASPTICNCLQSTCGSEMNQILDKGLIKL